MILALQKPKRRTSRIASVPRKLGKVGKGQGTTLRRLSRLAKQADSGQTVKLAGKSDEEILKLILG